MLISFSAAAATTEPYPVIPVEQTKRQSATVADEAYWFSLGIGAAHVSTYNALAYNVGLYGSVERFVYGVRLNGTNGGGSIGVRHGREQALMLGHYLDTRNMTWAGIGVSRVDSVGGRHPDQRYVDVGLPMEFVFSPPGRYIAPEIRLNIDLNKINSFMMLTIGARFGQLK